MVCLLRSPQLSLRDNRQDKTCFLLFFKYTVTMINSELEDVLSCIKGLNFALLQLECDNEHGYVIHLQRIYNSESVHHVLKLNGDFHIS